MIKQISSPKLKNPIFIAAWPGMGEVAYRCALFLKEVMGFKIFAKLEAANFFRPSAVVVDKGIISMPSLPAGFFYYAKGKGFPDIILFIGEAQPPLEEAEQLSAAIIEFVKKYKPSLIITFAAKPEPIDHKGDPGVWIAATDEGILKEFEEFKLTVLTTGQISGLNGIILGEGKRQGIKGVCLLGEIPYYTVQIENPRASISILNVMNKYFSLDLSLTPLEERSKFIEEEINKLIGYLKGETSMPGPSPLNEEDVDKLKKDLAAYTKLPQSARVNINTLFMKAQNDIAAASELKEALDHWNVYKEYEDKFLDLFKKGDRDATQ